MAKSGPGVLLPGLDLFGDMISFAHNGIDQLSLRQAQARTADECKRRRFCSEQDPYIKDGRIRIRLERPGSTFFCNRETIAILIDQMYNKIVIDFDIDIYCMSKK